MLLYGNPSVGFTIITYLRQCANKFKLTYYKSKFCNAFWGVEFSQFQNPKPFNFATSGDYSICDVCDVTGSCSSNQPFYNRSSQSRFSDIVAFYPKLPNAYILAEQ